VVRSLSPARRTCWIRVVALGAAVSASALAQADTNAAFVRRGRAVEARQHALSSSVQQFHDTLAAVLRHDAPDLLPRLEPPPAVVTGYQLLPKIVDDSAPAPSDQSLQSVTYSWPWSETLIENELKAIARLDSSLVSVAQPRHRSYLDSLVSEYRRLVDRKKRADADVDYNWLWQRIAAQSPGIFDQPTQLLRALLERQALRRTRDTTRDSETRAAQTMAISRLSAEIEWGLASDVRRVSVPAFVQFAQRDSDWTITVPIVTDIQDSVFLAGFARAVEGNWQSVQGSAHFAVHLTITSLSPDSLYCAGAQAGCVVPARGAPIDLPAHIAHFPSGFAVLTTGAASTHVTAGRAIVVSPHDAERRMLAHEFGHLLGFRDEYLRSATDAGSDGYVIAELVVDPTDIMGSYRTGAVHASHFERLLAARDVPALMQSGLDAFYARHDATSAARYFERVLAIDPAHYGANYQLAKALDQLGDRARARQIWEEVLRMARSYSDTQVVAAARKRLCP
jgi:hypothetical protein